MMIKVMYNDLWYFLWWFCEQNLKGRRLASADVLFIALNIVQHCHLAKYSHIHSYKYLPSILFYTQIQLFLSCSASLSYLFKPPRVLSKKSSPNSISIVILCHFPYRSFLLLTFHETCLCVCHLSISSFTSWYIPSNLFPSSSQITFHIILLLLLSHMKAPPPSFGGWA